MQVVEGCYLGRKVSGPQISYVLGAPLKQAADIKGQLCRQAAGSLCSLSGGRGAGLSVHCSSSCEPIHAPRHVCD